MVSIWDELHLWIIRLVVGRRPLIMNATIRGKVLLDTAENHGAFVVDNVFISAMPEEQHGTLFGGRILVHDN